MIRELKIWPEYFEEVLAGRKTFEIRENDRDFKMGDLLALNEYDPKKQRYTGRSALVYVDYAIMDPTYIREGYAAMSIKPCVVKRITDPESCHLVNCKEYSVPLAPVNPVRESYNVPDEFCTSSDSTARTGGLTIGGKEVNYYNG